MARRAYGPHTAKSMACRVREWRWTPRESAILGRRDNAAVRSSPPVTVSMTMSRSAALSRRTRKAAVGIWLRASQLGSTAAGPRSATVTDPLILGPVRPTPSQQPPLDRRQRRVRRDADSAEEGDAGKDVGGLV